MNRPYGMETRVHPRQVFLTILKWSTIAIVSLIALFSIPYGIDLNLHVTVKEWAAPIRVIQESLVCPVPNIPKLSSTTIPTVFEHDTCFNYVSILNNIKVSPVKTTFHTFWEGRSFTEQQFNTVRSFLKTQPTSNLIVWTFNEESLKNSRHWLSLANHRVESKTISEDLIKEFPKARLTQNIVRVATLYQYGGVWFDLSVLFLKDLSPLLDREWMTQGNCLESKPYRFTGSIMHFHKSSQYLCEIISSGDPNFSLFSRIYDRYIRNHVRPWVVLPWCYTDPSQCGAPGSEFDEEKLTAFAYHIRPSFWGFTYGSAYRRIVKLLDN